jgi:molybdopterin molybdotransferase
MPFEQAKQNLINSVPKVTETELVAIEAADQRTLSVDVISPLNVPAHNNSAMDGYALRDDTLSDEGANLTEFTLIGSAFAGAPFSGSLEHGQCIRIMTGAVVPDSANTVIMQENVAKIENEPGAKITLTQATKINSNIRFAGEDIKQNQAIFQAGHVIKAVDIGLLASLGLAQVEVYRKLKVAVFSTGDELKLPGQPLSTGDIYESNSQVLVAMLNRMGVEVLPMGIIPDSLEAITEAFKTADQSADAVISSGGVSVGEADYTKEVLDELGQVDFWKVAMKPGKPFAYGQLPNSVFFGLPGNPVSATVTFHQLALPALKAMSNHQVSQTNRLAATITDKVKKRPGRMDFQRGIAKVNELGQMQVTPLSAQGSGILSSISKANCYIVLDRDNAGHEAGEQVSIELFDHIIG